MGKDEILELMDNVATNLGRDGMIITWRFAEILNAGGQVEVIGLVMNSCTL